ncbi:MAG: hypothetical protein E6G50_06815 [Actinobacteria bacterium]|nr:MAG: hypothetical protein E6G50_06815 [Actinomycetota bacterium]
MPFLPEKRFAIDAHDAPDVIRERLEAEVEPPRRLSLRKPQRPFAGTVGQDCFELRPVLGYRNSFVPFVEGSYRTGVDGTRVDVRMRLLRPVAVFMAAWLGLAAFFVAIAAMAAARDPLRLGFAGLALAFFGVGYACMSVLFWLEARRTRAKLEELLR